jgi:hypothetical protein
MKYETAFWIKGLINLPSSSIKASFEYFVPVPLPVKIHANKSNYLYFHNIGSFVCGITHTPHEMNPFDTTKEIVCDEQTEAA